MADTLKINNDNNVTIEGLTLAKDGTSIDGATLTFTVYDEQDDVVTGTADTAMTFVTGTSGNYIGIIDKAAGLTAGITYKIIVSSSSHDLELVKTLPAVERTL